MSDQHGWGSQAQGQPGAPSPQWGAAPAQGAPPPPAQPPPPGGGGNGMATAALVLGILAILFGLLLGWVPLIGLAFGGLAALLGIVAVVLGLIGRGRGIGRGQATTGVVTGAVGAVAAIGWVVVWTVGLGMFADEMEAEFESIVEEAEAELGNVEPDLDGDGAATDGPRLGDGPPPFTPYSGEDAPAFEEVRSEAFEVGDLVFTDVEVLSDSFDDFLIRADVEHAGADEGAYHITGRILAGGEEVGTVTTSGRLGPGEHAEVHLDGFSDFTADYDAVEFDVD